jgi:DNA-binding NarL/FixJ family response regulator
MQLEPPSAVIPLRPVDEPGAEPAPRVLVVAGDRIVREWAAHRFRAYGHSVEEAPDLATAVRAARVLRPGAVLLDPDAFGPDPAAGVASIVGGSSCSPVVVLSAWVDPFAVRRALRAGARGYLSKSAERIDLATALATVLAGGLALDGPTLRALVGVSPQETVPAPQPAAVVALSNQQRRVIGLVAEGLTNHEVAARLHLSPHTVKKYLRNAAEKLDAVSRLDVVIQANRRGLIELPPAVARRRAR